MSKTSRNKNNVGLYSVVTQIGCCLTILQDAIDSMMLSRRKLYTALGGISYNGERRVQISLSVCL